MWSCSIEEHVFFVIKIFDASEIEITVWLYAKIHLTIPEVTLDPTWASCPNCPNCGISISEEQETQANCKYVSNKGDKVRCCL